MSPDLTRKDPPVPANLDATAAEDTNRNGRRGVIYAVVAVAVARADGLDWHRRRVHPGHERRRQDLAERDAAGRRRVEPRDDDRSVALRSRTKRTRPSIAISSPTSIRTSTGRAIMGKTWQEITRGLPAGVYVHVVKEDPARRGLLFAGTERRRVDVVRRRRHVADAAAQSAGDVDARLRSLRQRPDRRDARPRILGHRRHQRASADQRPGRAARRRISSSPQTRSNAIQGGDNGTPTQKDEPQALEPAEWRVHRLLPQGRR